LPFATTHRRGREGMSLSQLFSKIMGSRSSQLSVLYLSCTIAIVAILCNHSAMGDKLTQEQEIMLDSDASDLGMAAEPLIPLDSEDPGFSNMDKGDYDPSAHKDLLPLDGTDFLGVFLSSIGLMIAAGGGIGGGGILVPLYILVLGFSPKYAIPLSNITIFGGAITNTILNIPKRHPVADRPLVDWDLIMIMEPLTIAGAIAGSFVNKVLPDWILAICLILLLGATSYKTITKGVSTYKKETKALAAAASTKESELSVVAKEIEETEETEGLLEETRAEDAEAGGAEAVEPELQKLYDEERATPMHHVYLLTGMFLVIVAANLLKGGGAFPSPLGIECGTLSFWGMTLFILGVVVSVSLIARKQLIERYYKKKELGYKYVEGDIEWDEKATIKYPCLCFFAGFFAGMFGVGGGIVKGPLMLEMGVAPAVASATSAVMILYTSFSAATSFVVFGLLRYDYGFMLFVVGIICTAVGQVGVNYLVKKSGRGSYIIMSIGAVVALSTAMMGLQSAMAFVNGTMGSGGGICSGGGGASHRRALMGMAEAFLCGEAY